MLCIDPAVLVYERRLLVLLGCICVAWSRTVIIAIIVASLIFMREVFAQLITQLCWHRMAFLLKLSEDTCLLLR